jgi:hypothetical protein
MPEDRNITLQKNIAFFVLKMKAMDKVQEIYICYDAPS